MQQQSVPIITIDGPSGSGKGTIAALLADQLAWHLLDSGAIYRLYAYQATLSNIKLTNKNDLVQLTKQLSIRFARSPGDCATQAFLNNINVTLAIRSEDIGTAASQCAAYPEVRAALLATQRGFAKQPGLIADGRDMGSVVFPDACLKVYLDASIEIRAKRRQKQLQQAGHDVKLPEILSELTARDQRDKTRAISPLVIPNGALVLNSDELLPTEIVAQVLARFDQLKRQQN